MKARKSIGRSIVAMTQIGLLLAITPLQAYAATVSLSGSERSKLEGFESVLYGAPRKNQPEETRLSNLEKSVFGAVHTGSAETRLQQLQGAMGTAKGDLLMPPLAPTLDLGTGGNAPEVPPLVVDDSASATADSPTASLLQEAMTQYSNGDTARAESSFKRVLSLDPSNGDAHFNLGVIEESRGNNKAALDHYEKAYKASPDDQEIKSAVMSLRNKSDSIAQAKAENEARAREAAAQAQEQKNQDKLRSMVADASADYKAGNYSQAVGKLEKVARDAPTDPDVQYALGQAQKAQGNTEAARAAFNRANSIDPSNSLYKDALANLNNMPPVASGSSPYYGSSGSSGSDSYASSQAYDPSPAGQITPFNSSGFNSKALNGSADYRGGPSMRFGIPLIGGLGVAGMGMGMSGRRMKRTVAGGAIGAAAGAMWGATSRGSVKSGAVKGAILGGILGFLSAP
jgi:Tfp pilus assembly protein PilF